MADRPAVRDTELQQQLRRIAIQHFESLHRSGITHVAGVSRSVSAAFRVADSGARHRADSASAERVTDGLLAENPGAEGPVAESPMAESPVAEARSKSGPGPESAVPSANGSTVMESSRRADSVVSRETAVTAAERSSDVSRKAAATGTEARLARLDVIQREVAACRRCEELACSRQQTVFGVGSLQPRLCFFGEAPGADEDRLGEPFVGRAGQLLTDIIQNAMGLRRSDVYILNVLKCRPPGNRKPTGDEVSNCREYFERQLDVLQPEFICCLGATAVASLLGLDESIGRLRGRWFDYRGSRVMITYHPSYLLRNPAAKKDTWADIQMLMREMGLPLRAGRNRPTR